MTDPIAISGGSLQEALDRLSRKPGVEAAIALERTTGTILKTTGSFAAFRNANSATSNTSSTARPTSSATTAAAPSFSTSTTTGTLDEGTNTQTESTGADELAAMVWSFVQAAGGLVAGLDAEDEVKLLRLRTKKHELVIVPDPKYLLIVVHETPPA